MYQSNTRTQVKMKKLEEEFGLPPIESFGDEPIEEDKPKTIAEYNEAIALSDKINSALREVQGMEAHDSEMDAIAQDAQEAFKQLMSLGYNMTDMAAGPVFSNAASMLDIALKAKNSKADKKLKQIDLMLKKLNHDTRAAKAKEKTDEDEPIEARALDRNEILKLLNGNSD
jgi:hypothetical protein